MKKNDVGKKRAYFIVWRRSLQSIFFLSVLMLLHISLFYIDLGSPFFKLSTKLPQQQHRNRTTSNTTVHMCCCTGSILWALSLRIAVYCTWLMQCLFTCYSCCCRAVRFNLLTYLSEMSDKWRNILLLTYFSPFYCLLAPVSKFSINNEG